MNSYIGLRFCANLLGICGAIAVALGVIGGMVGLLLGSLSVWHAVIMIASGIVSGGWLLGFAFALDALADIATHLLEPPAPAPKPRPVTIDHAGSLPFTPPARPALRRE